MELYQILGWLNVWVFVLLVIKAPLKTLNKKLKNKQLMKINSLLTKYHKYLGIFMIVVAIAHAYVIGTLFRFNSGTLILIGIIITAIVGFLIRATRKKIFLTIHRILSIVVLLLMINHIYF
ncbi:hypothetical protein [Candidatus Arthromitus sp. SFB-turkey]|uniref:hypothetical protein n=1 Tax=Candidatus Arthromitus sp. SFB-turkey TaxID=1840217 RepID=UPI0007F41EC5|nr:hypothetical protein [Candidatus Arthromitus sp. SFB-turkey]OAT88881.1 hypothetical protein A6P36_05920 [Candidatus Arthromitus sp. SFB-turkey]